MYLQYRFADKNFYYEVISITTIELSLRLSSVSATGGAGGSHSSASGNSTEPVRSHCLFLHFSSFSNPIILLIPHLLPIHSILQIPVLNCSISQIPRQ